MHNKTSQEIKAGKNLAAAMLVKFLEMNSCKGMMFPKVGISGVVPRPARIRYEIKGAK